jgi:hypothetical protein
VSLPNPRAGCAQVAVHCHSLVDREQDPAIFVIQVSPHPPPLPPEAGSRPQLGPVGGTSFRILPAGTPHVIGPGSPCWAAGQRRRVPGLHHPLPPGPGSRPARCPVPAHHRPGQPHGPRGRSLPRAPPASLPRYSCCCYGCIRHCRCGGGGGRLRPVSRAARR